jgi:lipid-A-disaccharide synthase-like uncharacterized protein
MNHPFWIITWGTWTLVLTPWKVLGMSGAFLFASRWFVQAYYSRKAGRPVTPLGFWIMSVCGSLLLLLYFFCSAKQDIVGIVSNLFPCTIACYNLFLELRYRKRLAMQNAAAPTEPAPSGTGVAASVESRAGVKPVVAAAAAPVVPAVPANIAGR